MLILHIMASKGNGGAETYFADLVLHLHRDGVEQAVVCSERHQCFPVLRAAGVKIYPGPLRWPLAFLQRAAIRRLVLQLRPAIVHSWMRRGAALAPRVPGMALIGWFGGYYDVKYFRACTHFIGVTADIAAHIKRGLGKLGIPENRASLQTTFANIVDGGASAEAMPIIPAGAKVLLALSRLHPKKGLDTLLQALRDLPDCHAWLAGDGPLEAELKAQAQKLGVAGRAHFLGWRNDRGALIRAADIVVMPSRYEPFGTVVLEGWAAGKPVIAARATGPAATISDGEDGLLVPVDDATALAGAVRRVLDEPGLAEKLVASAARKHGEVYSPAASTARMIALYRAISHDMNV
ncbi:MAG: glycosyltransferase [Alphaproteobacteria bacterium]|nr:glycosyltransferase [Alphaproteobacteria bacterium]